MRPRWVPPLVRAIRATAVSPFARVTAIRGVRCRRARRVARAYDRERRSPEPWRTFVAHGDRPHLVSCGYPPRRGVIRRAGHALEAIGTGRPARPWTQKDGDLTLGPDR